jgi:hypothetical protein
MLNPPGLSYSQLRSVWAPAQGVCITPNIGSGVHYLIVTLITDTILLLTVLVGLLRLRHDGGGFHGLVQLLWKQVRGSISPFAGVLLTYCRVSLFKGVIWLLFACAAEIPPVVCLVSCTFPPKVHHYFTMQVFIILNLNGISLLYVRNRRRMLIKGHSALNIRGI